MHLLEAVRDAERLLEGEERLVRLEPGARTVFVGDIHGDLNAVECVLTAVWIPGTVLVFLGDVVDRGPSSRECLVRILHAKLERPKSVHLLMGNHEAWGLARFRPADFWESLPPEEASALGRCLLKLPLAAWHDSGVLALHGALPDLATLGDIAAVPLGGTAWRDITWGDWSDRTTAVDASAGRPVHGPGEFSVRAAHMGIRVLVRSHQPDAPSYLFEDRCLTLFTSCAYGGQRRVALLPQGRCVNTARDLDLIEI